MTSEIDVKMKRSSTGLYNIAKEIYVKRFNKVTNINGVLKCLYSFNMFNQSINNNSFYIEANKEKCYISF